MIYCHELSLTFNSRTIFNKLSLSLQQNDRVGLVGLNGAGKSTLLKIIAGEQLSDHGSLEILKNKRIAYIPQEATLTSSKTVLEETLTAFGDFFAYKSELELLESQLGVNPEAIADSEFAAYYSFLQDKITVHDSIALEREAQKVLQGLGFRDEFFCKPINTLSVGWRMRVLLAKLLLQKADFYLFDEPTNHLDIFAKDWLLQFLKNAPFGFLLVSHERYFLDELCTTVLELQNGAAHFYKGNYTAYRVQKAEAQKRLEASYAQQQREIKRKQATIERFRASASKAKMAQAMQKELDRIELITLEQAPTKLNFSFASVTPSGREVIKVARLAQVLGDKKIFENISFSLDRGEKVALIAPNGIGKTTLLSTLAYIYKPFSGSIIFGHKVQHAFFQQDQELILTPDNTILQEVESHAGHHSTQTIRAALGTFLFSHDDIYKKIKVLSGGEKGRVGLVKLFLQDVNFIMLDEPTNHLDIPSKEILLEALKNYTGTVLFVSHDHDFINKLATRILDLTPTGLYSYLGNYDSYLYQKQYALNAELSQQAKELIKEKEVKVEKNITSKNNFELRKKSRKLEDKIERIEKSIKTAEQALENLIYGTPEFTKFYAQLGSLQKEHGALFKEWEAMQELLLT